jgi:hypothetical protein
MTPTDDQIRDLLATYAHCRRWAHAGEVGANAVVLIAALEELLLRRANDIPRRVVGAEEVHGHSQQPGTASGGGVHALGLLGVSSGMQSPCDVIGR